MSLQLLKPRLVPYASRRLVHFKFIPKMTEKQAKILTNFDEDFQLTIEKMKRNQKIKPNRNTKFLSKMLTPLGQNKDDEAGSTTDFIPEGSPEALVMRRDGMSKTFLTTRMKVLNNNFTRAVSEIFATDEELVAKCEEFKMKLTQIRVSTDCKSLHIYWAVEDASIDRFAVIEYLNSCKSRIRDLLYETHYMHSVPWISFIYDSQANYEYELNIRFEKIREQQQQQQSASKSETISSNKPLFNRISFDEPLEAIKMEDYNLKKDWMQYKPDDVYRFHKLRMPTQMKMNNANLDYENLMNKVLGSMARGRRARTAFDTSNCYALDEPLPPLEGTQAPNYEQAEYNTEERINAIKKFVTMRRLDKNKAQLRLRRELLAEEMARFDNLSALKDALEERYTEDVDDYDDHREE